MIRKKFMKTKTIKENLLSSEKELIKYNEGLVTQIETLSSKSETLSFTSESPKSAIKVRTINTFCLDTAATSDDFSPGLGQKDCEEKVKPFSNYIQEGMNKINRTLQVENEKDWQGDETNKQKIESDCWSIGGSPPLYADYKVKLHNILLCSSFSSGE